ncbi:mechanosensitive ion channel family protein [Marinomonas algicola]|uniref:mechanosensitive ion channel family protein n=1 Tax=Marinomonas algicola TaxID=2773454 RepID=UPI00174E321B|nr:mechanosensitive ion channel family protein [Marinomonas algicola]
MEFDVFNRFWELIHEKLQIWIELGIKLLPNVFLAIVITILFIFIAKITSRVVVTLLKRLFDSEQIAVLLASIFKIIIISIGGFIALEFVGLSGTVTSILAGAGIIGLAIGFAFQDMTENLIAGIVMGIRKPFLIGDIVEADDVFGTIRTINLRNTIVETFSGQLETVPNKLLFRNIITNYSTLGIRKIEIPVGISYADDPEKAERVIADALNSCDFVIKKEETAIYAESFGDSSINLLVWFWIKYPGETGFMQARHKAISLIQKTLSDEDILIPFPIRTLDFGAKGGEKLDSMLPTKNRIER